MRAVRTAGMGLFDKVRGIVGEDEEESEPPYRCVRCGAGHDRDYHSCPDCGAQFVAPTGAAEDEEDETGAGDSARRE